MSEILTAQHFLFGWGCNFGARNFQCFKSLFSFLRFHCFLILMLESFVSRFYYVDLDILLRETLFFQHVFLQTCGEIICFPVLSQRAARGDLHRLHEGDRDGRARAQRRPAPRGGGFRQGAAEEVVVVDKDSPRRDSQVSQILEQEET